MNDKSGIGNGENKEKSGQNYERFWEVSRINSKQAQALT
jgi:hypothetical protein